MKLPVLLRNADAKRLAEAVEDTNRQVNRLTEGAMSAKHAALTSVPTTGTWAIGDFVAKSNPSESGSASSKYIITGWIRLTNGSDNVLNTDWFEARVLTGN